MTAPAPASRETAAPRRRVTVTTLARLAWTFVGVAACLGITAYVLSRMRVLVVASFGALALCTVLAPVVRVLERRHVPRLAGTWFALLLLVGSLALVIGGAIVLAADEFRDLDVVVTDGLDDVESWLVDGPPSLDRADVGDLRHRLGREAVSFAGGSNLLSGARTAIEAMTAAVLSLALAFFVVKDGPTLQRALLRSVAPARRGSLAAAGTAAWRTLAGYVRGMAIIGVVEGTAMMIVLVLVGADLAVPIGLLTVLCAFVPFIGAVVAGTVAVLAALVSGGAGDAAIVAVVALVLQQFDNELLAPVVYGRLTRLHPAVVLAAVAGGAGLAGLAGAVLAVPVVAASAAAFTAVRQMERASLRAVEP